MRKNWIIRMTEVERMRESVGEGKHENEKKTIRISKRMRKKEKGK